MAIIIIPNRIYLFSDVNGNKFDGPLPELASGSLGTMCGTLFASSASIECFKAESVVVK